MCRISPHGSKIGVAVLGSEKNLHLIQEGESSIQVWDLVGEMTYKIPLVRLDVGLTPETCYIGGRKPTQGCGDASLEAAPFAFRLIRKRQEVGRVGCVDLGSSVGDRKLGIVHGAENSQSEYMWGLRFIKLAAAVTNRDQNQIRDAPIFCDANNPPALCVKPNTGGLASIAEDEDQPTTPSIQPTTPSASPSVQATTPPIIPSIQPTQPASLSVIPSASPSVIPCPSPSGQATTPPIIPSVQPIQPASLSVIPFATPSVLSCPSPSGQATTPPIIPFVQTTQPVSPSVQPKNGDRRKEGEDVVMAEPPTILQTVPGEKVGSKRKRDDDRMELDESGRILIAGRRLKKVRRVPPKKAKEEEVSRMLHSIKVFTSFFAGGETDEDQYKSFMHEELS
ncbi:hypothetical protein BSKO_06968 [Bryopsis sp. KO-2023]|nr:hypothetical protein BSKO_06968 [Bryopsis sp. KO-2023]